MLEVERKIGREERGEGRWREDLSILALPQHHLVVSRHPNHLHHPAMPLGFLCL